MGSVPRRRLVAGFLAGASLPMGLLAIFVGLLFGFNTVNLLRALLVGDQGEVVFWPALGVVFAGTLGQLPGYLWTARWVLLALGLLGLLLAIVRSRQGRIGRPWRAHTGLAVTVWGLVTGVIASIEGYRRLLHAAVADRPGLTDDLDILLAPLETQILVGTVLAILLSWWFWVGWKWSYRLWVRLLHGDGPNPGYHRRPTAAPESQRASRTDTTRPEPAQGWTEDEVDSRGRRSDARPLTVPLVAGLAATPLLVYGALLAYDKVASSLFSGAVYVAPDSPRGAAALAFGREPSRLILSNRAGSGTVAVALRDSGGRAVREARDFRLASGPSRFARRDVDLRTLRVGEYRLDVMLREGGGGLVRYAALSSGGPVAWLASMALGMAMGLWWGLAAVGLLELLTALNWLQD